VPGRRNRLGARGLPGSENTANAHQGSPATGETYYSPSSFYRLRRCRTPNLPARRVCAWARRERRPRRSEGIAGRAQEFGETGRQGSEPVVVPRKPGDSSREDPVEGRGGRVAGPRSGHKARTPSLSALSTKRPRRA
jgi:hypothetical protein